jgi:flagellar biosynthetic protein FliR
MISLLPIVGSETVPSQLKAGLSFMLAILLFSQVPVAEHTALLFSLPTFILLVVKELFVGLTIGFASSFLFAAVQFAGKIIDSNIGLTMVEIVDPFTSSMVSITGQFKIIIFSMLFLVINGHYFMLIAIQKSFVYIPLCGAHMPTGGVMNQLVTMGADIFVLAIKLSAPIFAVLFLMEISLGIVARTVPQINIFFVGLPLKIGVGLATLAIVLPSLGFMFRVMTDGLVKDIWKLLYLMA